jgi:hypothetical protein
VNMSQVKLKLLGVQGHQSGDHQVWDCGRESERAGEVNIMKANPDMESATQALSKDPQIDPWAVIQ